SGYEVCSRHTWLMALHARVVIKEAGRSWGPPRACSGAWRERVHAGHVEQGRGQALSGTACGLEHSLEAGEEPGAKGAPGGPCSPPHRGRRRRETVEESLGVR